MRAIALLLFLVVSVHAQTNVTFTKVLYKPQPLQPACVTNIVISGLRPSPTTYNFTYPQSCPFTPIGANYQCGPCSISSSCTNTSANSVTVANAPNAGSVVGTVTAMYNGQLSYTNLVLNSTCTGATFWWTVTCQAGCSNCVIAVCRSNDTGCAQQQP